MVTVLASITPSLDVAPETKIPLRPELEIVLFLIKTRGHPLYTSIPSLSLSTIVLLSITASAAPSR